MENNKQEDLDIISLIKAINNGISSLFKRIARVFAFTFRHFFVFMAFMLLFAAFFLGLWFIKKPVYKSSMVLSHIRIENDYCLQMIKNLNNAISGKDNSKLAEELNLNTEYAKQVVSITYFPLNENISRRFSDSVTVLLPFRIEVETCDPEILDTLQKKLIYYLENNEYAQKLKRLDEEALNMKQLRLAKEINSIDSLKKLVEESIVPRSQGNGIILGEPINPVEIYKQSIVMFENRINISKALKSNDTFEVRIGFSKNAKRSDMSPIAFILIGMILGYITAAIVLVRRKRAKN
ncbi:MAG: hypothetical protein JNL60_12650 [Bacteroidia bacterium]|nr:hypothetical protein [Bacteroidia bacterium]